MLKTGHDVQASFLYNIDKPECVRAPVYRSTIKFHQWSEQCFHSCFHAGLIDIELTMMVGVISSQFTVADTGVDVGAGSVLQEIGEVLTAHGRRIFFCRLYICGIPDRPADMTDLRVVIEPGRVAVAGYHCALNGEG